MKGSGAPLLPDKGLLLIPPTYPGSTVSNQRTDAGGFVSGSISHV